MELNKFTFLGIVILAFAFLTGHAQTETVNMENSEFIPANIQVEVGTEITWVNNDAILHTSESGEDCTNDGIWDSGDIAAGESYSRTFNNEGTFPYFCVYHCAGGMTGTVEVVSTASIEDRKISGLLLQDFGPVPAKEDVHLTFKLEQPKALNIALFDLRGQKVMQLADKAYAPGEFDIRIVGDQLEAGTYVLRIKSAENATALKMIIY